MFEEMRLSAISQNFISEKSIFRLVDVNFVKV